MTARGVCKAKLGTLTVLAAFSLLIVTVPCFCQDSPTWWSRNFPNQPNPTVCPVLYDPDNGSLEISDDGTKATYSCNANYSVLGYSQVKCTCGQWFGERAKPVMNGTVCRRDGGWSFWTGWSECTLTCGSGRQTRTRSCTDPFPEEGGMDCPGSPKDERACNTDKCPVCTIQSDISIGDLSIKVDPGGSFVIFSCPDGSRLVGNDTQSCVGIDLSNIDVLCIKVCSELSDPRNGTVTVNDEGTFAVYSCTIGFSLQGSTERFCSEGVWSGSEPQCTLELIDATSGEVKPVGVSPQIGLSAGVFDIVSPEILVSQCNASATFNFRTTTVRETLEVSAFLTLRNNRTVTHTTVNISSADYSSSDAQSVCVPLVCSDTSDLHLPQVGRLRISVEIVEGTAEFSNVNFLEGRGCDGPADESTIGSCDNSTASGDCGYRNTGCGTAPFEVTLTPDVGDDEVVDNEDDNEPLVPILSNQTSSSCSYSVCLPCLQNSGFSISARSENETVVRRRKKRTAGGGQVKSLCLNIYPSELLTGELRSDTLTKDNSKKRNKYMSFNFQMNRGGLHELSVKILCIGLNRDIHLAKNGFTFKIKHYHRQGSSGSKCLEIHSRIESAFPNGECFDFYSVFEALGADSTICVRNVKFRSSCGKVDNED